MLHKRTTVAAAAALLAGLLASLALGHLGTEGSRSLALTTVSGPNRAAADEMRGELQSDAWRAQVAAQAAAEEARLAALAEQRASRSRPLTPRHTTSRPVQGGDFWRRLANCESPNGRSGRYVGYFQFSSDTASKVGIDGSESYEEQRAAAESWSHQVDPSSTAGWPVCWRRAGG